MRHMSMINILKFTYMYYVQFIILAMDNILTSNSDRLSIIAFRMFIYIKLDI